jgi:hypothetical protein
MGTNFTRIQLKLKRLLNWQNSSIDQSLDERAYITGYAEVVNSVKKAKDLGRTPCGTQREVCALEERRAIPTRTCALKHEHWGCWYPWVEGRKEGRLKRMKGTATSAHSANISFSC